MVAQISANGNTVILLVKKDVQDFINVLGKSHGFVDDYQKQVALLK